tara:strand:- start:513 stop:2348 length:1836 start_codon:yes stop_codon:yes gene_type:complete
MIEQTLFNYTNGDILELNGESYTGYYNVTNDQHYSGRKIAASSSFLTIKDNALGNFIKEKLYFNRIPVETLSLPYSHNDIMFEPGEFINQNSINAKLEKLNANYLELFNFTSTQTNDLPENFVGFIGASATNVESFGLNVTPPNRANVGLVWAAAGLQNIHRIEVIPRKLGPLQTTPDNFLSIYTTLSGIYAFDCPNLASNTTFTFRASSALVDGFNTRPYNHIADITTNGKDLLYVSDIAHNQIYRLYIDPLVNDSRITGNDLNYLNQGGVEINTTGNGILSSADLIEYGLGELYTYNRGSNTFVVLGKDLSFKRRLTNREIKKHPPVSFTINTVEKKLYVLLSNYTILKIPTDFKTAIESITLDNTFFPIESPKKIFFSKNNSNIYYVMTTLNLYKYFNVGANVPIGIFNWVKTNVPSLTSDGFLQPADELWDAVILDENNNYDSLFILNKKIAGYSVSTNEYTGVDKILRCNEANSRIKLLENELFRSFDLNDIFVNDQYFNSLTLNKSFKKLIFNMDILSSYLQSKFLLEYNQFDDLKSSGKVALTATPVFTKEYNMFTGSNEVVTPQVLNRCTSKIIDYQEYLLSILQGKLINEKYTRTELVYIAT